MAKTIKGRLLNSELGEMDGFTYGTIDIQTAEGRMILRITKETEGEVPPVDSIVFVEYIGDAVYRALRIETISEAEKKVGLAEELPEFDSQHFAWPKACASCGIEENLTEYSHAHMTKTHSGMYGYPTYSATTTTHFLTVKGYLCDECRIRDEEKNKIPNLFIKMIVVAAFVVGFILPFTGFLGFYNWAPQHHLYLPTVQTAILYVLVVGIPVGLYIKSSHEFKKPFLKYIRIYTRLLSPTNYKLVLTSPKYREKFVEINGPYKVKSGAGLSILNFDREMVCGGICCFGIIFPIIAALIFHLIMG